VNIETDVDLVMQLRPDLDVHDDRRNRQRDEYGTPARQRQPRAQAHGSRNA
jgi:hypothetical protein